MYNSLTRREASAALWGGSERSPEDRRVGRGLWEPLERRAVGGVWFLCEGGVRCVEEGGGGWGRGRSGGCAGGGGGGPIVFGCFCTYKIIAICLSQ